MKIMPARTNLPHEANPGKEKLQWLSSAKKKEKKDLTLAPPSSNMSNFLKFWITLGNILQVQSFSWAFPWEEKSKSCPGSFLCFLGVEEKRKAIPSLGLIWSFITHFRLFPGANIVYDLRIIVSLISKVALWKLTIHKMLKHKIFVKHVSSIALEPILTMVYENAVHVSQRLFTPAACWPEF